MMNQLTCPTERAGLRCTDPACGRTYMHMEEEDSVNILHADIDEGRYVRDYACVECHGVGDHADEAILGIAAPFEFYVAALDCRECGRQLIEFDAFTLEVR